MKRYYEKKETPLKYHYFLCVVLWLTVVSLCTSQIDAIKETINGLGNSPSDALNLINIGGTLFSLALLLPSILLRFFAALGLWRLKRYSWFCVIIVHYYEAVMLFVCTCILALGHSKELALVSLAFCIIAIAYAIPIHIYYVKRKPLFFSFGRNGDSDGDVPAELSSELRFCRQCGNKLAPGSSFCGKCGTQISSPEN